MNVVCASGPVSSGLDALDASRHQLSHGAALSRLRVPHRRQAGHRSVRERRRLRPRTGRTGSPRREARGATATLGAGSRQPPPGTFEGWSFSLDKVAAKIPPPRFTPPAATTSPAPTLNRSDCTSEPQPPIATTATTAPPTTTTTTATTARRRRSRPRPVATTTTTAASTTAASTTRDRHDDDGGHDDCLAHDLSADDGRRLGERWW